MRASEIRPTCWDQCSRLFCPQALPSTFSAFRWPPEYYLLCLPCYGAHSPYRFLSPVPPQGSPIVLSARRWKAHYQLRVLLAMLIVCTACAPGAKESDSSDASEEHFWSDDKTPSVLSDPDVGPIEVGTEFTPASDGEITAVRLYQGPENTGASEATLWASNGTKMASVP